MKAKQRHDMIRRLNDVQELRVAQERLNLVAAQRKTALATETAEWNRQERERKQVAFDQLVAGQSFCPTHYRIACETLLMVQAEVDESDSALDAAQQAESQQRLLWHQNRRQASWLEDEARALGNKLARTIDDKRAIEAGALIRILREQGR